jgi:uncharacterized protein
MQRMRSSLRIVIFSAVLAQSATMPIQAASLRAASAKLAREDFVGAARQLAPLAARGNARAQTMLGFLYETGQGVPQAYNVAAHWYCLGAEQGDSTAQYLLGLAYDKGHGVPQDDVLAYKWLDLAAARAPETMRDQFARLRDAVASKMTRAQIRTGQWLSLLWSAGSHI